MSWTGPGTGSTPYTFVCDSGCGAHKSMHADSFAKAWLEVKEKYGWASFKRTGHQWTYYCAACAEEGRQANEEAKLHDEERERMRKRNAEYRDG
jgi:hypothetical protein